MKLIASAFCIAALCSIGLAAQQSEVHTKHKVEVKNGRRVDVMGCVAQGADGIILKDVNGEHDRSYLLVGKTDDMSKYVGQWVEVTGKAADRDHGKVKVENKTRVDGQERKSEREVEGTNGTVDVPALGVTHVKKVRESCSM